MSVQASKNPLTELINDLVFDLAGCALFAVGTQAFFTPNHIAPGGVTGLSIILNYLTGWSVGLFSLLLNIPLLALAWFLLGRSFTLKTLKTVVILSWMLELGGKIIPHYVGEPMLASLFGGVLQGAGLAVVFMRGGTTGGTDVASRLLQIKAPHFPVGRLILVVDACVLLIAALVYRNIENALYGLIAIFASTWLLDSILYGLDTGRVLMIVSGEHQQIARAINSEMGRGATRLLAEGSYTGKERPVLLCAVRKGEFFALKRLIFSLDPIAFVLTLDASEILGEGFKQPDHKPR